MIGYRDLAEADLGSLGTAVGHWKKAVQDLETLATDARDGLQAKADRARWKGVNATVSRGFIHKTAKEFDDLHAEASSIYQVLDDAHRELLRLQQKVSRLIDSAGKKGLVIADSGESLVTVSMRTAPGQPVNEDAETRKAEKEYADQISSCLWEANVIDQATAIALSRSHGNDQHNPGHATYDSLDEARYDLVEYPPVPAEDLNRPAWGSAEPGDSDSRTFWLASTLALPYMALQDNKMASDLFQHWLSNSGEAATINPLKMMDDLPELKRLVGQEVKPGRFDSGWKSDKVSRHLSLDGGDSAQVRDWYYALNGYQYRVRGNVVDDNGVLKGTVTVDIYKRYNFGNPAGGVHRGDVGKGPVKLSQNDLAHLNTVGLARDFDVVGHETYRIG
ncbi:MULTISPECIES: hypothetical protein [unclassified Streptomyces]|uniref:hypothetical protein n=1 Tax=unclassified Streptomyces TaxID=2593676 RepID=UPI003369DA79